MINKKVSIIVPVFNCEIFLNRCIKSILKQSHKNFELILVDDGSKDNSNAICREYENFDTRVRVFSQENSGASTARNVGIYNAQGDYIMFVDSDDYIEEILLETLVKAAENENADFVMCGMIIDTCDVNGKVINSIKARVKAREINGNRVIAKSILDLVESERISGPWCKLISSSVVRENHIKMPEHIILQEDLYFNIKVLEHIESLCVVNECLYHYIRGIGETTTARYIPEKYEMTNEVHDALLKYYTYRCDDEKVLDRINYIYVKNAYAAFINLFHTKCEMTKKEKLHFIEEITKSKKYDTAVSAANRRGVKYKILRSALMTKNEVLIYYVSKVLYMLKYKFNFRY